MFALQGFRDGSLGFAASLRHKRTFERTLPTSTEDVTDKFRERVIL